MQEQNSAVQNNFMPAGRNKDLIISAIIGLVCAILIMPILKNLDLKVPYMLSLIVILPLLSVIGMWTAYLLANFVKVVYQLAKFILVGALNTLIDWGILNLLMFLTSVVAGSQFLMFKGFSFLAATTNSYFWNKFWTFKKADASVDGCGQMKKENAGSEFAQFLIVSVIGFGLNLGVAHLIVNVLGAQWGLSPALWANFGALCGTLLGLVWNFLGYKLIVFKS